MDDWWFAVVAAAIVVAIVFGAATFRRARRSANRGPRRGADRASAAERQEALFKATFPELQPLFHPAKVLEFVAAWRARSTHPPGVEWQRPPGLNASRARLSPGDKGEAVELFDAAGAIVSRFRLQQHPDGGVIRLDPGKFTVNLRDAAVRYWHPEREFKWSRAKGWRLITRLSDHPIESNDRGFESSRDTSSFPSASTTAAVIAGAGGAFAGAGASAKWDAAADSSSASAPGSDATLAADAPILAAADGAASDSSDAGSDADSAAPSSGTAY